MRTTQDTMPVILIPQNKHIHLQRETLNSPDTQPQKSNKRFMKNDSSVNFRNKKVESNMI
jgi:hypothetical protein